jgi:hypothetical protein
MTDRGGILIKRTLSRVDGGKDAAASPVALPLFGVPELEEARKEREELRHKLMHQRLEAHSRIRIEQKLKLLVAKIIRLELQLGDPH